MENSEEHLFTIGELADKVGVTVRTLQYYDKTGLLKSTFSAGGRRMYTRDDVIKLQQILFLKSFGFPLEEIKDKILHHNIASDLGRIFAGQREILLGQINNLQEIVNLLDTVQAEIKTGQEISLDKLMTIMGLMKQGNPYSFVIRYFDDEQLQDVVKRFHPAEESQQYVDSTKEVFAQLNTFYQQGIDPSGKEGQDLAARWWEMVNEFTGGDRRLLEPLLSAGMDIENWPEETRVIRDAIVNFLEPALSIYFHNNNIELSKMEEGNDE